MRHIWIVLCLVVGCLQGATNEKIPVEVLFGNPKKVSPKISPDGSQLAYLAPDENDALNIWVGNEGPITTDKRGIHHYLWHYSSNAILYLQDLDGDENFHLFRTDLITRKTEDLTPFEGVKVSGIIAYEMNRPNEILIGLNFRDPSLFDVYQLNLDTGNLKLIVENNLNAIDWIADHDLNIRGYIHFDEEGDLVSYVREDGNSSWVECIRWTPFEEGKFIGFSNDNQSFYMLSNHRSNTVQLIEISMANLEERVIASDPNFDITHVLQNPISHQIEAVGAEKEKFEWVWLNSSIEEDFKFLKNHESCMYLISRNAKDCEWIVAYLSDCKPVSFYRYHRDQKSVEFLFSSNPDLEKFYMEPVHPISFEARDGMKIFGYLTLPTKSQENVPAVLFVHGGPWARDTWRLNTIAQWLANRGYAVLQVNYRGSSGYGKEYLNAGNREWAGKMHTDILDGKKWLVEQGIARPDKVAIFGGSYGGYATLVGLSFTPEEFACGIDLFGPSNIVSLLETVPPYWKPMKTKFDIRVGKLETEVEFLESRSPLFKADQIIRPLLIAQGANDPRVKQSESDQIVKKMRENGQYIEYLIYDNEGHGFVRPENFIHFIQASEIFLEKSLK